MLSFDEFADVVDDEMNLLPDYAFDELNGGVVVDERPLLHPARVSDDLYILGTYTSDPVLGKQVRIYYGSFTATMSTQSDEAVRRQIRETLRHEFQHHLETRAGMFGKDSLVEEDRRRLSNYFRQHLGARNARTTSIRYGDEKKKPSGE